jgi:gluconate 5-dehydrogenase
VKDTISKLFDLTGRSALITGGSRGLGLQIATALGEAGARVVLVARNGEEVQQASSRLRQDGLDAAGIAGDASLPEGVEQIAAATLEHVGHLDILVNGAGTTWGAPAEDYPLAAWDKVMALNVRSAFLLSQYFAKRSMIPRRSGKIIMLASIKGLFGNARHDDIVAYNASKAALINLTRALAGEWGEFGINVNAIAPGWFPSRMTRGIIDAQGADDMAARAPLRRLGDDEDLKGIALLLASNAGKHITGQTIAVDGGVSAVGD